MFHLSSSSDGSEDKWEGSACIVTRLPFLTLHASVLQLIWRCDMLYMGSNGLVWCGCAGAGAGVPPGEAGHHGGVRHPQH